MTGKKKRSLCRKKIKAKGFSGSRRQEKSSEEAKAKAREPLIDQSKPGPSLEQFDAICFSRKKMKLHVSTDESSGNSEEETETEVDVRGYRLKRIHHQSPPRNTNTMEVSPCEPMDITIGRLKKSDITYIVCDISPG